MAAKSQPMTTYGRGKRERGGRERGRERGRQAGLQWEKADKDSYSSHISLPMLQ